MSLWIPVTRARISRGSRYTCALVKLQLGDAQCDLLVTLLTIEVIGCTVIIPPVSGRSEGEERFGEAIINALSRDARKPS